MTTQTYTVEGHAAQVFVMPLMQEGRRREREQRTEELLLERIFGNKATLNHTAEGKPFVEGTNIHISISHSKTRLAIGVSADTRIGIDIEDISPRLERVKHKFLTEEEHRLLPTGSLQELAICWSAKEAVYKVAGEAAGALGENIKIDIPHITGKSFHASVGKQQYNVEVVEQTADYEIVAAWEC